MGFFSDFASSIGNVAINSAGNGFIRGMHQTQLNMLSQFASNGVFNGSFLGLSLNKDGCLFDLNTPLNSSYKSLNDLAQKNKNKFGNVASIYEENRSFLLEYPKNEITDENYHLEVPQWSYGDFINERNIFIKHLSNGYDEPGWFYFKVFFKFNTDHGLFGGILNDAYTGTKSVNGAAKYLSTCDHLFKYEKLNNRFLSLKMFASLLSYINVYSPWVFSSIKNISSLSRPQIDKFTEDKYIELELNQESIDMRITSLLSLYKYACYDDIYNKEILPENLRKFDMSIVIFEAPVKFVHDIFDKGKFKSLSSINRKYAMSFKMYQLINCEIDLESIGTFIPGELKNETPFELGKNTLKINFDKVYEHHFNEFLSGLSVSSDGVSLNSGTVEIKDIQNLGQTGLTILSENLIHDNLNTIFKNQKNYVLGNIFGQDFGIYQEKINQIGPIRSYTRYATTKFAMFGNLKKYSISNIINSGFDTIYKLLGLNPINQYATKQKILTTDQARGFEYWKHKVTGSLPDVNVISTRPIVPLQEQIRRRKNQKIKPSSKPKIPLEQQKMNRIKQAVEKMKNS